MIFTSAQDWLEAHAAQVWLGAHGFSRVDGGWVGWQSGLVFVSDALVADPPAFDAWVTLRVPGPSGT